MKTSLILAAAILAASLSACGGGGDSGPVADAGGPAGTVGAPAAGALPGDSASAPAAGASSPAASASSPATSASSPVVATAPAAGASAPAAAASSPAVAVLPGVVLTSQATDPTSAPFPVEQAYRQILAGSLFKATLNDPAITQGVTDEIDTRYRPAPTPSYVDPVSGTTRLVAARTFTWVDPAAATQSTTPGGWLSSVTYGETSPMVVYSDVYNQTNQGEVPRFETVTGAVPASAQVGQGGPLLSYQWFWADYYRANVAVRWSLEADPAMGSAQTALFCVTSDFTPSPNDAGVEPIFTFSNRECFRILLDAGNTGTGQFSLEYDSAVPHAIFK